MSVCLSARLHLSVCFPACLFVHLLTCLSATLSVYPSAYLSVCICLNMSVCLLAYLPACLSVCLLFCLPICPGWARKAHTWMLENKLPESIENYFQLTWTRKKIPDSEILISDGDQVLRRTFVAKLDFPKQQRNSETWIQCEQEKHQLTWSKIIYKYHGFSTCWWSCKINWSCPVLNSTKQPFYSLPLMLIL